MSSPDSLHWKNDLACLLYDGARLIRRRVDERLADLGFSDALWRVMGFLSRREGMAQTELAMVLGMQKAPLGEHLDKLEAQGFLLRKSDPNDRRVKRVYLTDRGSELAVEISRRYQRFSLELQSSMSQRQWQGLQRGLAGLDKGFSPDAIRATLSGIHFTDNLHLVGVLSRQLRKQFDGALKTLGFTRSQWLVLSTVVSQEGIKQTELGRLLDIPKAPLGQVLDRLEQEGWLQRRQDETDGRVKRLKVADKARPAIAAFVNDYKQLHRLMSEHLGEKEMELLKAGLSQLREKLLVLSSLDRSGTYSV